MKQVHLNNSMMLHVDKDRTHLLSLIDVACDFVDGLEYRLSIFGTLSGKKKQGIKLTGLNC